MTRPQLVLSLLLIASVSAAPPTLSTKPSEVCELGTNLNVLGPDQFKRPGLNIGLDPFSATTGANAAATAELAKFSSCGYAVASPKFYDIVDTKQKIRVVATANEAFAHEAPVYVKGLNELFFTSNRLGDTSSTAQYINAQVLDLETGEVRLLPDSTRSLLQMPNGASNYIGTDDTIVLVTQGSGNTAPQIVKLNLETQVVEPLLDNYYGRQFNSLNDVIMAPDGSMWFTDPSYGFAQKFRPAPQLGTYVYRFDPATGGVRVMSDKFVKPNGLCFSPDFKTLYVTDTGAADGTGPNFDPFNPQTVYAFDVVTGKNGKSQPSLQNRRVIAVAGSGFPDGVKTDTKGNVYTGTATGVEVFSPAGERLGEILVSGGVANFAFAGNELYMLGETIITVVKLKALGADLP